MTSLSPRLKFAPAAAGAPTVAPKRPAGAGMTIMVPDGKLPGGFRPMSYDAFAASKQSKSRGYIVLPTLDTRREISSYGRIKQIEKARWGVDNDEIFGRLFLKYPRLLGYFTARADTPDAEWNRKADSIWADLTSTPAAFDRSGKYSWSSYQIFLNKREVVDGDELTAYTTHRASGDPAIRAYEGHLVGDGYAGSQGWGMSQDYPRWNDGVLIDDDNAALAYRILDPDNQLWRPDQQVATRYIGSTPLYDTDLDAASGYLYADWSRAGQARGVTRFHRIINSMLDVREIDMDLIGNIKSANMVGWFLGSSDSEDVYPGAQGIYRQTYRTGGNLDLDGNTEIEGEEAGVDADQDADVDDDDAVAMEDLFDATGGMLKLPGWKPEILADPRPHQNYIAYLENWKIRKMALSFDLDAEVIWALGGLNGNTARLLKEDVQDHIEKARMERLLPWCIRTRFHFMSFAVQQIGHPRAGHFMQTKWIPPKRISIDRGAEGRLNLDEMTVGARSYQRHFAEQGMDDQTEREVWLNERKEWLAAAEAKGFSDRQLNLIEQMLFRLPPGVAPPPMEPLVGAPESDPEDKEE